MPLYKLSDSTIEAVPETKYSSEGLLERSHLQRSLRDNIEVIAPGTLVLAEEFGRWDDSKRRIDLLLLDESANLVVVELKRTLDGGFMDLQSIRYAAMVSNMTFAQAVEAHAAYLKQRTIEENARERILQFLGWDSPEENDFAQEVRIVLASAEFSKELTTSVLWLLEHDIDIRCVRLKPYRFEDAILVNAEQVIPLPEAEDYQIKVREKGRVERKSREHSKDLTKFDVTVDEATEHRLPKRRAIFAVVKALTEKGADVAAITDILSWRGSGLWRIVDDEVDSQEFREQALLAADEGGLAFDPGRWFHGDDELIYQHGKSYALTKMWGERTQEAMDDLLKTFPNLGVSYQESS